MRDFYKQYLSLFIKVIILLIAIVVQFVSFVLFCVFFGLTILRYFASFVD